MADTLKIEIEVNGNAGEGGAAEQAGIKNQQAKDNLKAFWTLDRAKAVAQRFATQIFNEHVNLIGQDHGNYVLQERVQRTANVANKLIGIGMSFAINPYLGMLNLASEGISAVFTIHSRMEEMRWQNRAAGEMARRAGYLSNRNR